MAAPACPGARSLVVNTTETYQTVDGFGACIISYDLLPSYQDPGFYDRVVFDLGLSILRIPIGDLEEFANDNEDPDFFDWDSLDPEGVGLVMEIARQFQLRGLEHVIATPWSPPGWMKTNRFSSLGGRLRPDMRDEYGEFLSTYVNLAREHFGVNIDTVSLQNESLFIEPYKSCVYNPLQMRETLRAVSDRFAREQPDVRLVVSEDMGWADRFILYLEPLMADPGTRTFNGFFASHGWNGADNWRKMAANLAPYGKKFWMTETSGHNPDWKGGLALAQNLHDTLAEGNASAYIYWQFEGRTPNRFSLLASGESTPKTHAMRHFSRFIRPGAERIHIGGKTDGLQVSAWKHPISRQVTLVLINLTDQSIPVNLTVFDPEGGPLNWLTFSSQDGGYMTPGDVPATSGFAVPAMGMVTAVGKSGQQLSELAPLRPPGWTAPALGTALTRESAGVIDERLHGAARNNEVERVGSLLDEGVDPNALNAGLFSPLHRAAWPGHVDVIQPLTSGGANVNARGGGGSTPIHVAVTNGRDAFIQTMVAAGAEVDLQNDQGVTPLHLAALAGHLSTVQILLDLGADPNKADHYGWNALHWAGANASHSTVEIIRLLADRSTDVSGTDTEGKTPLHIVAANFANPRISQKGPDRSPTGLQINADRLRALVDAGAEVGIRDNQGRTALHWAAWLGETRYSEDVARRPSFTYAVEGIRFLLSQGADARAVDNSGRTPADYAKEEGYVETVGLFEDFATRPWLTRQSDLAGSAGPSHLNGPEAKETRARYLELGQAAASGDLPKLRALLATGIDPNAHGGVLHDAVIGGHLEAVKILLAGGADATIRDSDGYTAEDRSRQNNQTAMVEVLQSWPTSNPD